MIKTCVALIALSSVVAVSCLRSSVLDNINSKNVTWDANLPKSPFTNDQIEGWIGEISKYTIDEKVKQSAIDGLSRLKRNTPQKDSSHWCCMIEDPKQSEKREMIKSKVVQKTISSEGTRKCGFLGLNRCGSSQQKIVTATEYYIDYYYALIPASNWTNGCPEANIVCCEGYTFWPELDNCLTEDQVDSILIIAGKHIKTLTALDILRRS